MQLLQAETRPTSGRVALVIPTWVGPGASVSQGLAFRSFTMGAALRAAGYDLVFFEQQSDLERSDRWDAFVAMMASGVAVFLWMNESYPAYQSHNTAALTARIKRDLPHLTVVVGGEMVTICPASFFDFDTEVDFFLRGYGEQSGVELLRRLAAGQAPDGIPGLVRPGRSAEASPPARQNLPFPEHYLDLYRLLDLTPFIQSDGGVFGNGVPTLSVAFGRGCTKGCAFCCWRNHPSKILGPDAAFALLRDLFDRYGVTQFHVGELDFFMSRPRALALADRLASERPAIRWFALGSPVDLAAYSEDDWDRLAAGGLRKVELGSESGSPRILRRIGKRHEPEDIYRLSARMLERGIVPMNNFLFGFPGETAADRAATMRLVDRLMALDPVRNHFTYRHYQPTWGTPLGDACLAAVSDPPARIDTWLPVHAAFARADVRSMPWIEARGEAEVKQAIDFDLPLATSRLHVPSPLRRRVYGWLRKRARRRLGAGRLSRGADRWLFDHLVGDPLDQTFVP